MFSLSNKNIFTVVYIKLVFYNGMFRPEVCRGQNGSIYSRPNLQPELKWFGPIILDPEPIWPLVGTESSQHR